MIAEALDTLWTLLLAGGLWLLGLTLAATATLYALGVATVLAWRTARWTLRKLSVAVWRPRTTPDDSSVTPDPHGPAQTPPRPSWAQTEQDAA